MNTIRMGEGRGNEGDKDKENMKNEEEGEWREVEWNLEKRKKGSSIERVGKEEDRDTLA